MDHNKEGQKEPKEELQEEPIKPKATVYANQPQRETRPIKDRTPEQEEQEGKPRRVYKETAEQVPYRSVIAKESVRHAKRREEQKEERRKEKKSRKIEGERLIPGEDPDGPQASEAKEAIQYGDEQPKKAIRPKVELNRVEPDRNPAIEIAEKAARPKPEETQNPETGKTPNK